MNQAKPTGAICRTCGGTPPNHVPSVLDPNGIGNPSHRVTDQIPKPADDELDIAIKQVLHDYTIHAAHPFKCRDNAFMVAELTTRLQHLITQEQRKLLDEVAAQSVPKVISAKNGVPKFARYVPMAVIEELRRKL